MRRWGWSKLEGIGWRGVLGFLRVQTPRALLAAVCVVGSIVLVHQFEEHYAVGDWLAWRLLLLVGWTGLLNLAFVIAGHALLCRFRVTKELPLAELLVGSFVAGLSVFGVTMFGVGALGWFTPALAVTLPTAFIVAGASDARALVRRIRRAGAEVSRLRVGGFKQALAWCASGVGALYLGLLYLQSLDPNNLNFDAVWYHVPIAQDYAREGRLVPFYGDDHRAFPHLASLLHTWALLVPGIDHLPLRWMLMLHIEYSVVLWRAVGVLAGAQWLLRGRFVPGLWASFFLFPSVFIYDQNIAGSADHVSGVSAIPIFLALGRALPQLDRRWALLCGVFAGCHILAKYQAVYLVVAVAACVLVRVTGLLIAAGWRRVRSKERAGSLPLAQVLAFPFLVMVAALVVSGPHFVKNVVFYDNPVYPLARGLFPSDFEEWKRPAPGDESASLSPVSPSRRPGRPALLEGMSPQHDPSHFEPRALNRSHVLGHASGGVLLGAANALSSAAKGEGKSSAKRRKKAQEENEEEGLDLVFPRRAYDFSPKGRWPWERLAWAHKTMVDWSFETGNRHLTKLRPYMGSLFTLLLPALLFLGRARRLWFGAFFSYWAFLVWALTSANDRYLLSFLSVVAAITAALIVRVFQAGWLPRLALIPLVSLQVLWNADVPLHYGDKGLKQAVRMIERGYSRPDDERRFSALSRARKLTDEFPEDALILGRYYKELTGFDRATLNTHRNIQHYIPFDKLRSVREFWEICVDRGVTHLMYPPGNRKPEWAQDIVLFDALVEYSEHRKSHGLVIAEVSKTPPPEDEPLLVLTLGMSRYADGLHPVHRLSIRDRDHPKNKRKAKKAWRGNASEKLLRAAGAALLDGAGRKKVDDKALERDFTRVERFGRMEVWIRKRSTYD